MDSRIECILYIGLSFLLGITSILSDLVLQSLEYKHGEMRIGQPNQLIQVKKNDCWLYLEGIWNNYFDIQQKKHAS